MTPDATEGRGLGARSSTGLYVAPPAIVKAPPPPPVSATSPISSTVTVSHCPVVELRRLGRRVPRDLLRVLERPPVRQIRRDPTRPRHRPDRAAEGGGRCQSRRSPLEADRGHRRLQPNRLSGPRHRRRTSCDRAALYQGRPPASRSGGRPATPEGPRRGRYSSIRACVGGAGPSGSWRSGRRVKAFVARLRAFRDVLNHFLNRELVPADRAAASAFNEQPHEREQRNRNQDQGHYHGR